MAETFVSEPLVPEPGSADASAMAAGAPGLPRAFIWRDRSFHVEQVLKAWKDTGPCTHGSGERYVRKHWFDVRTAEGPVLRIYCDRRPARGKPPRQRWWVFSINEQPATP